MTETIDKTIYQRPVELLQRLIRFDTSNPPGNERGCVEYIRDLLAAHGIEAELYAKHPDRPNLVARLRGKNPDVPPLLLYGHVDVVPAGDVDAWQFPPFEGRVEDGFVWGRGALDMKGAVVMMLCAFIKTHLEGPVPPGDVVFCALADEEERGEFGARFMVVPPIWELAAPMS